MKLTILLWVLSLGLLSILLVLAAAEDLQQQPTTLAIHSDPSMSTKTRRVGVHNVPMSVSRQNKLRRRRRRKLRRRRRRSRGNNNNISKIMALSDNWTQRRSRRRRRPRTFSLYQSFGVNSRRKSSRITSTAMPLIIQQDAPDTSGSLLPRMMEDMRRNQVRFSGPPLIQTTAAAITTSTPTTTASTTVTGNAPIPRDRYTTETVPTTMMRRNDDLAAIEVEANDLLVDTDNEGEQDYPREQEEEEGTVEKRRRRDRIQQLLSREHQESVPTTYEPPSSTTLPPSPPSIASNPFFEGQLRLVGGRNEEEGNVQIFHMGEWGSICDDEWDSYEAAISCRQLGFPGAKRHTYSSQFGYSLNRIWMDNLYCYGSEANLTDCRFDGWGIHDCERTEAAGVQCKEKPPPTTTPAPTTTPRPKVLIHKMHGHDLQIRLAGGRDSNEGRVEARLDEGSPWGTICGDGWGVREAVVVCKELGLNFAHSGIQTHMFSGNKTEPRPLFSGVSCKGSEEFIAECSHDETNFCPGSGSRDVAAVVCVREQADLQPDLYEIMSSVYLEDKHLFFLQCAMEENCLASEAYRLRRENPNFSLETRRLLRFTASIANVGNADFSPFIPKTQWQWHSCHQHYHSMEVFAHFDLLDHWGNRVAEGHKASFCLEDNDCDSGIEPHYDCENYGDQGITPGCKDIYHANIDCQWLDVTDLELGTYTFRLAINPEYKVAEQTFENNAAVCTLIYTQQYASINNCSYTRP